MLQDQARLGLCLFISVLISIGLKKITVPLYFQVASITATIALQSFMFGYEIMLLWLQQLIVYGICRFGPRKRASKTVIIESFFFLILIQLRRMYINYASENVDITAPLMMQTFVYIGFATNYQKGAKNHHDERAIIQLPSFLQYLSFVLFVPACLVGPFYEYNDFRDYVYRKNHYKFLPSSIPAIIKEFRLFLLSITIFVLQTIYFPMPYIFTQQYSELNPISRTLYAFFSVFFSHYKYNAAWSAGMFALHAVGITYNPKMSEGEVVAHAWDRIRVNDVYNFDLNPSMKKKTDAWNISIQIALKRYIYQTFYEPTPQMSERVRKKLQRRAQYSTLFVSALWHGLYPCYFITFFHWGIVLQICQQLYRVEKIYPVFSKWRHKLWIVELVITNYAISLYGSCFVSLTWENTVIYLQNNYGAIICTYILFFIVLRISSLKSSKKTGTSPELVDKDNVKSGISRQKGSEGTQKVNACAQTENQQEKAEKQRID